MASLQSWSQTSTWKWAKAIGSSDQDRAESIVLDANGNVYTTGFFSGTVDFDPSPSSFNLTANSSNDIFILKMDSAGNFIWAKSIVSSDGAGSSIVVDNWNNLYITGEFDNSADFDPGIGIYNLTAIGSPACFILKLDTAGNFKWVKKIDNSSTPSAYVHSMEIACDSAGNVFTVGFFRGTVDFDPDTGTQIITTSFNSSGFILSLDSSGSFNWVTAIDGNTHLWDLTLDDAGNIYSSGDFSGIIDLDPGIGTYYLSPSGSSVAVLVYKLNNTGDFVWANQFSGTGNSGGQGRSIALDALNNVYCVGEFRNIVDFDPGSGTFDLTSMGTDIFISKLDSNGNFLWAKGMGDFNNDGATDVSIDNIGNANVAGHFGGAVDFDPGPGTCILYSTFNDIFLFKLDSTGNFLGAVSSGGGLNNMPHGLAIDTSSNVYLTGSFDSPSITFGAFNLQNGNAGYHDIFIAKIEDVITGIENAVIDNKISIYPNPSSDQIKFLLPNKFKSGLFKLYNITGKSVFSFIYQSPDIILEKSVLASGIYFYRITDDSGEMFAGKIVFE